MEFQQRIYFLHSSDSSMLLKSTEVFVDVIRKLWSFSNENSPLASWLQSAVIPLFCHICLVCDRIKFWSTHLNSYLLQSFAVFIIAVQATFRMHDEERKTFFNVKNNRECSQCLLCAISNETGKPIRIIGIWCRLCWLDINNTSASIIYP